MASFDNSYLVNINDIPLEKRQKAQNFAEKVVKETYNTFGNLNEKERIQNIYIGKIAEEIFAKWYFDNFAILLNVNYDIYPGVENVDSWDFNVKEMSIDIKSSRDTKNEGIKSCFNYFNFPVLFSQKIKDITISILYDFNCENFSIVSWIDKKNYLSRSIKITLPVRKGVYKEYHGFKLINGKDVSELKSIFE